MWHHLWFDGQEAAARISLPCPEMARAKDRRLNRNAFSFRPQGNYRSIASGARTEGGPVPFVRDNGQTTWKRLPGPESALPKPGLQTCHINPDQLSCSRPKGLLGPTIPVSGAYPVCPPCYSHVSPPPPSCPHFSPWDWPVGPDTFALARNS